MCRFNTVHLFLCDEFNFVLHHRKGEQAKAIFFVARGLVEGMYHMWVTRVEFLTISSGSNVHQLTLESCAEPNSVCCQITFRVYASEKTCSLALIPTSVRVSAGEYPLSCISEVWFFAVVLKLLL